MSETDDPKQRILAEATRLFAARGFEGVSVQAVAEAVGMRGPSLLYHYRTKDQLRDAVLAELTGRWKDELPRVLLAAQTGSDRFEGTLRAMLDFFLARPDRARLLLREALDRPDAIRALLTEHLQPWTRMVTDYIRAGQAEGRVRAELDPDAYVLQVVTAALGTIAIGDVTGALVPAAPTLDAHIRELVRAARVALFNPRPE